MIRTDGPGVDGAHLWRVPYSAPGSLGGWMTVWATDADDAATAVIRLMRYGERSMDRRQSARWPMRYRLPVATIRAMTFGTPERVARMMHQA